MSTLTQQQHKLYTYDEWTNQEYFSEVIKYLNDKNINSFIDLGGCSGEVSKILLEKIPSIEYGLIFEPNIDNYNFIKKNVNDDRVIVENKAVYYGENKIRMSIRTEWKNIGSWSTYYNEDYPENSIEVECVELESYLKDKHYNFAKIDIEGSEFNLIENSKNLTDIDYIELEVHYNHYSKEHDKNILEYLEEYLPQHEVHYYLGDENFPGNLFLVRK